DQRPAHEQHADHAQHQNRTPSPEVARERDEDRPHAEPERHEPALLHRRRPVSRVVAEGEGGIVDGKRGHRTQGGARPGGTSAPTSPRRSGLIQRRQPFFCFHTTGASGCSRLYAATIAGSCCSKNSGSKLAAPRSATTCASDAPSPIHRSQTVCRNRTPITSNPTTRVPSPIRSYWIRTPFRPSGCSQ